VVRPHLYRESDPVVKKKGLFPPAEEYCGGTQRIILWSPLTPLGATIKVSRDIGGGFQQTSVQFVTAPLWCCVGPKVCELFECPCTSGETVSQ